MRKFLNIIYVLLVAILVPFTLTSCNRERKTTEKQGENNQVEFNFDDKYFIGMQEHFYEIRAMERTCTTDFICDLNQAIGSKVFRLNVTLNNLFIVERGDTVRFNTSTKEQMEIIVDKLVKSGVERIVYATDSFIYPYGYSATHTICAPDPYSERDAYERWVTVNSKAMGLIAKEFPEIKYFEVINEPDIPGNEVLCKNGMLWGTQQAEFMYTAEDEANILADLNYYMRREVKKVDESNMMMTAAFSSLASTYDFLEYFYGAIESGAHPIKDEDPCSVDPDDYFDIMDLHPYAFVAENIDPANKYIEGIPTVNESYVKGCMKFYEICCKHGDAEKPHWYTELGFTDRGLEGSRVQAGIEVKKQLELIKTELPFVECVIFYKMTDLYEYTVSISEDYFGLFTALMNPDHPLELKPIMKEIYAFMHDGSTDYSAFDAVRDKYLER